MASPWPAAAQQSASIDTGVTARQAEYDDIARRITLSEQRRAELTTQIEAVEKDNASITAALIQAAKTEKKLAQDADDIGGRLERFKSQEEAIRASLAARRGVLAEVLGALQRMGLNPPPAILVKPEDALSSVRSAILLGAVVPELREQTDVLLADMRELSQVTASIESERNRLVLAVSDQVAEKERLTLLLDAKKKLRADAEAEFADQQRQSADLAEKAKSLKELIADLEAEAERRRKADEAERAKIAAQQAEEAALAALPENNKVMASLPFDALKGQLALPVLGRFAARYGTKDDNGGVMQGDTVATQSGAIVTAPSDGNVLYAGPFRSYGQLLILDAGGGYHVVLAGMARISVGLGQSVLAGEPVGAMGESRTASSVVQGAGNGPEIYVEFRRNGKPVDPSPWWADRRSGRTGNDT